MHDQDYDDDGNNIVPCPICLDVHCAGKEEGGKCPKEDEFARYIDFRSLQEETHAEFDKKSNYVDSEFIDGEDHPLNREKVNNFLSEYLTKAYNLGRTHENVKLTGEIKDMDKFCCPDAYSQPENDELILQSKLLVLLDKSKNEIQ